MKYKSSLLLFERVFTEEIEKISMARESLEAAGVNVSALEYFLTYFADLLRPLLNEAIQIEDESAIKDIMQDAYAHAENVRGILYRLVKIHLGKSSLKEI